MSADWHSLTNASYGASRMRPSKWARHYFKGSRSKPRDNLASLITRGKYFSPAERRALQSVFEKRPVRGNSFRRRLDAAASDKDAEMEDEDEEVVDEDEMVFLLELLSILNDGKDRMTAMPDFEDFDNQAKEEIVHEMVARDATTFSTAEKRLFYAWLYMDIPTGSDTEALVAKMRMKFIDPKRPPPSSSRRKRRVDRYP